MRYCSNLTADRYAVVCDFDGTVTPCDVTDEILGAFASAKWEEIEAQWVAGRISAHECMSRQIPLLDASLDELDAFLDDISVTDGFVEFATYCREERIPLTIVSDGLDYSIRHILQRNGLAHIPVVANRLLYRERSGYRLEFPYGREGCPSGVCKCSVAAAVASEREIILIGDGLSDCCIAKSATVTLARNGKRLHRHCMQNDYPHLTYTDFFDVLGMVASSMQPRQIPTVRAISAA